MAFWELFIEDLEKLTPNICSHVHAKGWIIPDDVSLAVFSFFFRCGQTTFRPHLTQSSSSTRKNRQRNIIWYNPPFSMNVATNVGRVFLKILDEEFTESHVFHKIFLPLNGVRNGSRRDKSMKTLPNGLSATTPSRVKLLAPLRPIKKGIPLDLSHPAVGQP